MLVFLVQFVIRGCAAIVTTGTDAEDLSQFSRGAPMCPDQIGWPQVPAPLACDDPACGGISWAVPPYRCRQRDGVMFGNEVFGCRCCPRLVDCDDPKCAGSPNEEICRSELLDSCVCVASNRRAAPPTSALLDAATAAEIDDVLAEFTLYESLNNDVGAITPSSRNCPLDPPVRCLDPQCRGSDDWKTETSSTPRCNQADGKLVTDGTETALHGCPCCPEYIACSSTDCNGGANQAYTSFPLHGCFCDWPGRGPILTCSDGLDVLINDAEAFLDDPDYHPFGGQILSGTAVSFTASSSMFYEARPLATQRSTVPVLPQNLTRMNLLSSRQEAFGLLQNGSVFVMPDHFKPT
ncbi:uncharacterized protein BP5553_06111 [Venustampulla echinocandica]|uniref:Uncharacterized protein n=1 Tax=Venustampulla echinocandica TaxID=2656787 RepID=A0A370TMK5_9HELO|nr:uncharacterized protein BP5553_06111 [Venustampulla echinocandica]RDL36759.1 hypothetical protein BP5553_06111 [Venustampulla echinocandica]